LHDLGKQDTREETVVRDKVKVSFIGHQEKSAETARAILDHFRFSESEKEKIIWLVENHIRAFDFPVMGEQKAKEFASHPLFPLLIELAKADTRGSLSNDEQIHIDNERTIDAIEKRYAHILSFKQSNKKELNYITQETNGHVIIKRFSERFGKEPLGVIVGQIQKAARGEIGEKNITDVEEARRILEKHIEAFGKEK
ncbi:MAG: hypothetical protein U1A25_00940, partial [Candidatus Sungbacteria bacterium]|nr:hypothetical protein [Candidatus Sungbacteria bacterium]